MIRLAEISDRTSPTVFAGREDEFALFKKAVNGVQRGESGHTVVIQGVPGAGKTALLKEYAARMLTASADAKKSVIPVPLLPGVFSRPSGAIVREIDKWFRKFEESNEWKRRLNQASRGASLIGNTLFAAFTKKSFEEFRPSTQLPDSLPDALEDYVAVLFDRCESTIVLLVDEAQNLSDTDHVREHLLQLHNDTEGSTQILLAFFGLQNTTARLRELGLSRLANGHVRTIGELSDEAAKQIVTGTLESAFARFAFDDGSFDATHRSRWIDSAATTILSESANFPHHLTNSCRALAEVVLDEGIGETPPTKKLRDKCREHKREYYDARLYPWNDNMIALAHAFGDGGWTKVGDVKRILMASDDLGNPVDAKTATNVIRELCAHGYIENRYANCHPVLSSLTSHFSEIRNSVSNDEVLQAIRAVLPDPPSHGSGAITR